MIEAMLSPEKQRLLTKLSNELMTALDGRIPGEAKPERPFGP